MVRLDDGVVAVEPVDFDRVAGEVGQGRVMTPVGPQALLGGLDQAGAAHDQAAGHPVLACAGCVGAFGDLCLAAECVVDVDPCGLVDRR